MQPATGQRSHTSPAVLAQSPDGAGDDGCPIPALYGEGEALGVRRGMNGRSISNPRYKDVDLEPLETELIAVGTSVQVLPPIIGVSPDSAELIVFLAKSSRDDLRAARVRGEAKNIKDLIQSVSERADVCAFLGVCTVTHLWLATFAARVEFARHPTDKTAVLYPNLLERADSDSGDVEESPSNEACW